MSTACRCRVFGLSARHERPGWTSAGTPPCCHRRICLVDRLAPRKADTSAARRVLGSLARVEGHTVYLVDPASSHMLVSKIKPCMSKYILKQSETANGSLNQLWFLRWYNPTWITVVILELIHATKLRPHGKSAFIRTKPIRSQGRPLW